MNTQNLTIYRIPTESAAWFRFRTTGLLPEDCEKHNCPPYASGIGASEIGNILGLQKKYRPCKAEVYHIKSGGLQDTQQANRAMIRGKMFEPITAQIWKLFDGETESWVQSIMDFMGGNRQLKEQLSVRNCRKVSGYYVNNEFPYLFSSLDYFAEKNTMGMDKRNHPDGFPVECKTISTNYSKLWLEGVPPSHVAQINQEMMCTNSDYGEIAVLFPDNFEFKIFPFNRDEELCDRIKYWGNDFWQSVLRAREARKEMDAYSIKGNKDKADEMQSIIDSGEPEPDNGEAYEAYMKERYTQIIKSTPGDSDLYDEAMHYKLCSEIAKLLEQDQQGVQNKCLKLLETTGAEEIDFDALGKITYYANKNKVRTLRIDGVKSLYPIKQKAEDEFNKIDFNLNPL